MPGVYASVQKAECFIKWSMACNDEYAELPEYCRGFLDSELKKLEDDRDKYRDTLYNAPEGALRRIDRLRLESKIKKNDWYIDRIQQTRNGCNALPSEPATNPYPRLDNSTGSDDVE